MPNPMGIVSMTCDRPVFLLCETGLLRIPQSILRGPCHTLDISLNLGNGKHLNNENLVAIFDFFGTKTNFRDRYNVKTVKKGKVKRYFFGFIQPECEYAADRDKNSTKMRKITRIFCLSNFM